MPAAAQRKLGGILYRQWHRRDLPQIMAVQLECYRDALMESMETIVARWEAAPAAGFWVAIENPNSYPDALGVEPGTPPPQPLDQAPSNDEKLVGYVQSWPWDRSCGLPSLDSADAATVVRACTAPDAKATFPMYYVHDVASIAGRGRGVGAALMRLALEHAAARGEAHVECVAVGGMEVVWRKLGFVDARALVEMACYATDGKPAVLMTQELELGAPPSGSSGAEGPHS